jgi:S-DNA-T family DNA segregation ATPase FtsK/SpoIIIE
MERRYNLLEAANVDSIETYHRTVSPADRRIEPLPYIVLVINEIADLMSEHGDFAEKLLRQLAVFARGVGIHVILSTSSHEPRILRSTLRANIFGVVCFATSSTAASEAFLYQAGAEALMGRGAALYTTIDTHVPAEIQTGLITESDIVTTVLKVKRRYGAVDDQGLDLKTLTDYRLTIFAFDDDDDLYEDAKKAVLEAGKASTSFIQRELRIGYSRAARLIDLLEERGVIGPQDGSNPREILE